MNLLERIYFCTIGALIYASTHESFDLGRFCTFAFAVALGLSFYALLKKVIARDD